MINFHKVLIATAIVFTVIVAIWSGFAYTQTRNPWAMASAVGFAVAAVVLVLYLKNLRRFLGT
jgi:hypothetical protein